MVFVVVLPMKTIAVSVVILLLYNLLIHSVIANIKSKIVPVYVVATKKEISAESVKVQDLNHLSVIVTNIH